MYTGSDKAPEPKAMNVLHLSFNQDQGCFAIAHEEGFLVYNTNPIELRVGRSFSQNGSGAGTGIGHISMLHRTNYLAMVGGGKNPKFPTNKVIIWDDLKKRPSLSLTFESPVINVMLSRTRIVCVLHNLIEIYEFTAPPKKLVSYETNYNVHGIVDLSTHSTSGVSLTPRLTPISSFEIGNNPKEAAKHQILAFTGRAKGQIQLVDVSPEGQERNVARIVKAHKSELRFVTLSRTGALVASASELGTIIRVHLTQSTALVFEFRRGLDRADITLMKFLPNDCKLAVLSDKGTLHVFNLVQPSPGPSTLDPFHDGEVTKASSTNRLHMLKLLKLPLPFIDYFQSTWSSCSVNTSKYHEEYDSRYAKDSAVIGWSGNDTVLLVWKKKKIWEKYVITESSESSGAGQGEERAVFANFSLTRVSWKSLV